jgi:hypothetical protein
MKYIFIIFFIVCTFEQNVFPQQFQWYRNFPAEGRVATIDSANNIYAFGIKDTSLFIIKYSPSGNIIWQRSLENFYADQTYASFTITDKQCNIYFTCQSLQRYALLKYDSSGNQKWVRYYDEGYCTPYGLVMDSSGFVYLTGESSTSIYRIVTIKYNSDGDSVWTRKFDGGATYGCSEPHMFVNNQGEVFIGGYENTVSQNFNFITFKYNSSGVIQWVSRYNGPANYADKITAIKVDKEGYVYITGVVTMFTNKENNVINSAIATIKYTPTGDTVWYRYYLPNQIQGIGDNMGQEIEIDSAGNVYIVGRLKEYLVQGSPALWINKYDKYGNTLWTITDTNAFETNSSILYNNHIYLSGSRGGISYASIYDLQGNALWRFLYPPFNNFTFYSGKNVFLDKNRNIYLFGMLTDTDSLFIYKFSPLPTSIFGSSQNIASEHKLFQNYPNPFNPVTKINYELPKDGRVKLVIYDILGREIKTLVNELKQAGKYIVEFNGTQFASGVYFYRIQVEGQGSAVAEGRSYTAVKKMVLIK